MSSSVRPESQSRLVPLTLAALITAAFVFGGGGSRYAIPNLIVQLAAFAVLAAFPAAVLEFWRKAPFALKAIVALTFALPLVQLIPLPPDVWAALPGRQLALRAAEASDMAGWMPISLYPMRTALALSALVTPLAILAVGWSCSRENLFRLVWLVVGLGLMTVLLGSLQVVPRDEISLFSWEIERTTTLLGTFANRNSTGIFLITALGFATVLPPLRRQTPIVTIRILASVLILVAIILTKSRTALVLALIPVCLGLFYVGISWGRTTAIAGGKRIWLVAAAVIAVGVMGLATAVTLAPGRLAETLDRFENAQDDGRRYIWDDAAFSVSRYWPVGSGMGTFDDVFQADESLENLAVRRAGRAHNDLIEITIEAGAAGVALVGVWFVLIAAMVWQARRSAYRFVAWAAGGSILAIALQSITDYPLRNQTMLATSAVALLILARIASERREQGT